MMDQCGLRGNIFLSACSIVTRCKSEKMVSASQMTTRMSQSNKSTIAGSRPTRVCMISLGCAKNLVDAEIMLGSVLERGMEITSRAEEADVLVVNTCAFIDSAKEESIEAILEAHRLRAHSENKRFDQKLIVSGCMSQRFADELRKSLPEVDAFIGLDQVRELGAIIEHIVARAGDPGSSSL